MSKNKRAGCILIDNKNHFLVVHQIESGKWGVPKGRIEENESAADAALRELREETGWIATHKSIKRCISIKQNKFFIIYTDDCELEHGKFQLLHLDIKEIDRAKWVSFNEFRTMPKSKFMEELTKKIEYHDKIEPIFLRKGPGPGKEGPQSARRVIIASLQRYSRNKNTLSRMRSLNSCWRKKIS